MFPDVNTPNMIFGGIKFLDVPVCHIKSSRNNTILHLTKANGKVLFLYYHYLLAVLHLVTLVIPFVFNFNFLIHLMLDLIW